MPTALPLGPFDLLAPVGHGGMAQVWRGVHRASGLDVAVKILEGGLAFDRVFQQAFVTEVRAVAGLHHPGVVLVFEHGALPPEVAAASEGRLSAGAPYLVMEYAGGGTLLDHPPRDWAALRDVLTGLLDALGHAHARGVIHRDLKGGNVLLCTPADLRPGWKLSDFGLALPVGGDEVVDVFGDSAVGTPPYMAPEQFLGDPRDFGPPTDLYALACLTWLLSTGSTPFGRGKPVELARAHAEDPPPLLLPHFAVPTGLQGWLGRLLEKSPWDRFQSAAEAARALWRLDGNELRGGRAGSAIAASQPSERSPMLSTILAPSLPNAGLRRAARAATPESELRFPTSWRPPDLGQDPIQLQGAGLGLLALRRLDLVGRTGHRDRLWTTLERVWEGRGLEFVLLHGEPGQGKSRLVEWLGERAAELGIAATLRVHFGASGGANDGLGAMLVRHLGLHGLRRAARVERVTRHLDRLGVDPRDVDVLLDLSAPLDAEAAPGPTTSPAERHAALTRLLVAEGRARPVILWLDNLQHGAEGRALLAHLAANPEAVGSRILVLATAWTESVAAEDDVGRELREIAQRPGALDLPVRPLSERSQQRLLGSLLALEPSLAQEVTRKAEGNPLFALQMVGDLAERGVLAAGPAGFALIPGARASLPGDIHGLWQRRIDRALAGLGPRARGGLELAAALGERVARPEWERACARATLPPPESLEAALLDAGLARSEDLGFSFSHGLLRDSVERGARFAGRWEAWSAVCADTLMEGAQGRRGARLERVGRHLIEARRWADAIPPLLESAQDRARGDDCAAGLRLLDLADGAIEKLGAPPSDRRRGEALAERADACLTIGAADRAVEAANLLSRAAREHGWRDLEGRALLILGQIHLREYRAMDARLLLTAALERLEHTASLVPTERALRLLARALGHEGAFQTAAVHAERAFASAQRAGDASRTGEALQVLAALQRNQGHSERAEELTRQAADHFARSGHHLLLADAFVTIGEARRERGDLEAAHHWFGKARDLWRRVGSEHAVMGALCVAGVEMERKQAVAGLAIVLEVEPTVRPGSYYESICIILRTQGALIQLDWVALAAVATRLEEAAKRRLLSNPEYRIVLAEAREAAEVAGRLKLAARFEALRASVGDLGRV